MSRIANMYCPSCKTRVAATKDSPSHVLHFFLTLFTAGLWLIVWIFVTLNAMWHCNQCGNRVFATKLGSGLHTLVQLAVVLLLLLLGALAWAMWKFQAAP